MQLKKRQIQLLPLWCIIHHTTFQIVVQQKSKTIWKIFIIAVDMRQRTIVGGVIGKSTGSTPVHAHDRLCFSPHLQRTLSAMQDEKQQQLLRRRRTSHGSISSGRPYFSFFGRTRNLSACYCSFRALWLVPPWCAHAPRKRKHWAAQPCSWSYAPAPCADYSQSNLSDDPNGLSLMRGPLCANISEAISNSFV